jgi:hypothetical protein
MKLLNYTLMLSAILLIVSCSTNNNKVEQTDLTGTWTLFKEVKNEKTIDYSGVPSAAKIEFKDNGYFLIFDKITDEKISNAGVGTIQDNLKGQFEIIDNVIRMNHYVGDSLIKKDLEVVSFDEETLVLKDPKTGKTSYFKK